MLRRAGEGHSYWWYGCPLTVRRSAARRARRPAIVAGCATSSNCRFMLGHVTDPAAPDGLDRRELPEPEPGPHDVLVAVRAYAVNRGELSLLQQRADGWQPGQDVAGVVARAAADGSGPPAGARVVGIADGGGWSERVPVPSHRIAVLPDGARFEDAAALPVAGLTALRALREAGPLLGR